MTTKKAFIRWRIKNELELHLLKSILSFESREHPRATPIAFEEVTEVLANMVANRLSINHKSHNCDKKKTTNTA